MLQVLEAQHAFDEVFLYRGKGVTEGLQAASAGIFQVVQDIKPRILGIVVVDEFLQQAEPTLQDSLRLGEDCLELLVS